MYTILSLPNLVFLCCNEHDDTQPVDDEGMVRGVLDDLPAGMGDPSHPVPGVERRGADVGGAVPIRRAAQHQAVPVHGVCVGGVCHLSGREVSACTASQLGLSCLSCPRSGTLAEDVGVDNVFGL